MWWALRLFGYDWSRKWLETPRFHQPKKAARSLMRIIWQTFRVICSDPNYPKLTLWVVFDREGMPCRIKFHHGLQTSVSKKGSPTCMHRFHIATNWKKSCWNSASMTLRQELTHWNASKKLTRAYAHHILVYARGPYCHPLTKDE